MITQANPALLAFYYVTAIKDWTHVNIAEYAKLENKNFIKVAKNPEFDKTRLEKAETIRNNWEVRSLFRQKLYIKSLIHQ